MKTRLTLAGLVLSSLFLAGRAPAAETIKGQVLGGGAPIANSRVTLYAATAREPKQLAQTRTNHEGQFELRVTGAPADSSLYIVVFGGKQKARGGGDNPAIGLLAVLGSKPPTHVVISEMTPSRQFGRTLNFWLARLSEVRRSVSASQSAMCPISLISQPADGAK